MLHVCGMVAMFIHVPGLHRLLCDLVDFRLMG